MNKNKHLKYENIPIVSTNKLYLEAEPKTKSRHSKILLIVLIMLIIFLLMASGYSMAKVVNEVIINTKAEIAEPILIVDSNPAIDITEKNGEGIYTFKIKNYNEKNEVTNVDLKYNIEILGAVDNAINIELFEEENKVELKNNKTREFKISKDKQEEKNYKIKLTYDKEKASSVGDLMEHIQVKVHTEQLKA